MKHLRYDMQTAYESGEKRHAQVHMKDLGITYLQATPQSIGDQWWFWCCENMPDPLPACLTELDVKPIDAIGYGLTKEMAEKIAAASSRGGE